MFNIACRIAEAFDIPDISRVLRHGYLFHVDRKQSSNSWDWYHDAGFDERKTMLMDFHLPFPETIVQEEPMYEGSAGPTTCGFWNQIILNDEDNELEDVEFTRGYQMDFFLAVKLGEEFGELALSECMVTGSYRSIQGDGDDVFAAGVKANCMYYILPDGELLSIQRDPDGKDKVLTPLLVNCISVLTVLNQPSQFIMEITPKRCRPPTSAKIPRGDDRPRYVLLTPQEIKKRYLPNSNPEHDASGKRSPHPRRAHWRTFRDERYVNKKGTRQWIESIWVGESERVINGVRYRVLLDR